MPKISESVIPGARAAYDASSTGTTAQKTFECVAANAIITACDAGAFTCTFSLAGATSQDAQYILSLLRVQGYTVTEAVSVVSVFWGI